MKVCCCPSTAVRTKTAAPTPALTEMAKVLNEAGIETTIFHIGSAPVGGCVGCGGCSKAGKCVFGGPVADVLPLVEKADGIVFGAPVHYATAAASMLGFMHRLAISGGKYLRHKPAAVVTSARRAGTTTALEAMEKVPQFFEMPLISSTYWPMVHGGKAEEVLSDEEGLQIMRNLGRNMAWMLRCIEAGKAAGIAAPVAENDKRTNFIQVNLANINGRSETSGGRQSPRKASPVRGGGRAQRWPEGLLPFCLYAKLLLRPPLTSSSVTALVVLSAVWAFSGAWPVGQTFCKSAMIGS